MADIEIGDLVLRFPGATEAEAERFAWMVAEAIMELVATGRDCRLGVVDIRLPAGDLRDRALARQIAERVARSLA
jgi:hypothetical protein